METRLPDIALPYLVYHSSGKLTGEGFRLGLVIPDFLLLTRSPWVLTPNFRVLPRNFRILTRNFRVLTQDFRVLTLNFRMLTRDFRMLTRNLRMLTRNFRIKIRKPFLRLYFYCNILIFKFLNYE